MPPGPLKDDQAHFRPGKMLRSVVRRAATAPQYALSKFGARDPHLWLAANRHGFRDSPRYIAEHVAAAQPELEFCWLANDDVDADRARMAGLGTAIKGTVEATRLQRRAGVAFMCNGFHDFDARHLGGAFLVHLFHGTALKRTGLDVDFRRLTSGGFPARVAAAAYRWSMVLGWSQVGMFVAPSELARERYMTSFRCPPERIKVLGSPRFDVIRGGLPYERVAGGDFRARLGLEPDDYVVLWLPTWREMGDAGWLPYLTSEFVEQRLGATRIRLLAKPHPFSDANVYKTRLPRHPRVNLLEHEQVDVNALLHIADALVTDYSSAAFDYAVLERPIHFFAPDLVEYAQGRDFYDPFESVSGGRHHATWDALLRAIAVASESPNEQTDALPFVAASARNVAAPGSSERIVQAVAESVGITLSAQRTGSLSANARADASE